MTTTRIQQRDSVNHTIFNVLQGGTCVPEENYELAKGWLDEGLLDLCSERMMGLIEVEKERERGGLQMRQVVIRQKGSLTLTVFLYGGGGSVFPEHCYQRAKKWLEEGLLCESSKTEMKAIEEARERRRTLPGGNRPQ